MRFSDVIRLSLLQLRVNPLRTAFTLLGIVVSVGFLVAVVAIIQGMNAYVKENIADAMIGMNTFQVRRLPISLGLFNDDEFRLLRRRPRVDERDAEAVRLALPDAQAISLQSGWPTPQADVVWRNRTLGSVLVFGVTEGYQVVQDYKFTAGRPLSDIDVRERRNVVVIGTDVATKLFDNANAIDQEVRIMGQRYTVIGVIGRKGRVLGQSFDGFALMPITAFEALYGRRQSTTVSVKMREASEVGPAMARAEEAMRVSRGLRPGESNNFDVGTADALVDFWKQLTRVLFAVVPAVVAIGVLVGGIVIMNIMLMAVTERTHEIGLRKAVGATAADVRKQFLAEAIALAVLGGALGVASGWMLATAISTFSPLPARVSSWSVGLALTLGAGIGVLFGVYPASRAAKLDPITAMRAETLMSLSIRANAFGENIRIALDALRVSKLRSSLTILGVVIGVATVMAMAAIVQGIRDQIVHTIEVAGPTTFYVMKKFSTTPLNPDNLPKDVRIRPDLTEREADRIRQLPEIGYASLWAQTLARIDADGVRSQSMAIFGADDGYMLIQGGELQSGRWFTRNELMAGAPVVVLQENTALRLFGQETILGRWVRVGGRPAQVIGIWIEPGNIFAPPGQQVGAIVPYRMMDHQFELDRTNALWIPVKPREGVSVADAQGAVTMALREMRGLRPADGSTFDLITQDQVLDTFNGMTSVFFLVMIVLSAVALLVGGIGVMAIMTVSVTSRTREIGVRKALGATRRDILQQFLIEAATLTGIGGAIGILVGLAFGRIASVALDVDAPVPVVLTIIAVCVSVGIGIVFGMIPAQRASRLDPIEALRHE